MATIEEAGLCDQILANIYGLVRNMRDNANAYKAIIAGNEAGTANIMKQDADLYLIRIKTISDLANRNLPLFTSALGTRNVTVAAANNLKQTLTDVANHTKVASLNSVSEINTEANFILANVPNFERLW